MLSLVGLHIEPRPGNEAQGERAFWAQHALGTRYVGRWLMALNRLVPAPRMFTTFLKGDRPGWWNKVQMFERGRFKGRCLYSDLDNVFARPLDALCALTPSPIIMCDDIVNPGMPNASLVLFDADSPLLHALYDEYAANPAAIEEEFAETKWPRASDQAFIADRLQRAGVTVPLFQDLLPAGYLLMAKELEAGADWSNTHVVCGQGMPKPHESKHAFFAEFWHD